MDYVLTEEEKNRLIEKYINNVNNMNKFLTKKISTSTRELEKRLNDPNEVKIYLQGKKLNEERLEKNRIAKELGVKYPHLGGEKSYTLERSIHLFMKPENTEENRRYNEELYKCYVEDPKGTTQFLTKKYFEINPKEFIISRLGKDPMGSSFDFYEKHKGFSDYGFTIGTDTFQDNDLNPTLDKYKEAINHNGQFFSDISGRFEHIDDSFFTIPKLTEQITDELLEADDFRDTDTYEEYEQADRIFSSQLAYDTSINNIKKAKAAGLDIQDPDFLFKYATEVTNPDGTKTYVGMNKYLNRKPKDTNLRLVKLTDEEVKEIKKIYDKDHLKNNKIVGIFDSMNEKVEENYKDNIFTQYGLYTNRNATQTSQLNTDGVIAENKGGFWERFLRRTSPQFKAFREAFKEYEKKDSPFYHNKDVLRQRAAAYLKYKKVENFNDIERLGSTGKQRALLCLSAFDGKMEDIKDFNTIEEPFKAPVKEQVFESEKDLENVEIKEYEIGEDIKENNIEIEEDQLNK